MTAPSIRRQLTAWVLAAVCLGVPLMALAAYALTLRAVDRLQDDSLRQTALLLADRDLRGAISMADVRLATRFADTASQLVAIARSPQGELLFTSEPALALRFEPSPGLSSQSARSATWRVYSVVQGDRVVQVAQPISARRQAAAQAATRLLVPLLSLAAFLGLLLVISFRRGMRPLARATDALGRRNARSLEPLSLEGVPVEILPVVRTLNDLLERLATSFEAQRHFVADAAHELRSPITALQLQAQILERSRDPVERQEASGELFAGIGRARRLLEQLLQLSRAAADDGAALFPLEPALSLDELARAAVVRWEREAERRGIDLGADAPRPVTVRGNAAQLDILLNNLVENALRYTPRGGVVDVIAEEIDGLGILRVVDTGPGVAPADRERVFDRFYRGEHALGGPEAGSGLGLAIVKSIAERHGATVTLRERPGGGLEVRVAFAPARDDRGRI